MRLFIPDVHLFLQLVGFGAIALGAWLLGDRFYRRARAMIALRRRSDTPPPPPILRGILRGGRFRLPFTRDGAKHQLYRLAAQAGAAGDEGAARALEHAALLLAKWPDWREQDRLEMERRDRFEGEPAPAPRQASETPVYGEPGTKLLGYLGRYDPGTTSFLASGGVLLSNRRGNWVTTAGPEMIAAAFPGIFRVVAPSPQGFPK